MLKTLWMTSRWALLPVMISLVLALTDIPDLQVEDELFHVLIESGGALIGFGFAYVLMALIEKGLLAKKYTWLIACFVAIGTIDLFHSMQAPGETFVWLHSLATFSGGLFALLIWLPSNQSAKFFHQNYFYALVIISAGLSLISIFEPAIIPGMLDENQHFTWQAKLLNSGGGVTFLTAWLFFAREYHRFHQENSYYFSNIFCLFAVAAFMFEFSVIWDGNWWFWHMIRALAYLLLIYHFGKLYRRSLLYSLEKSENRLHAYIDSSPDWIWEVDEKGIYTFASPKVLDLLGYHPEEVIGKTPFDLMPPEEATRVAEIFGKIVAAKQPFHNLENVNVHKNGQAVVLETSGVPVINEAGELSGYHGIDRDITQRKAVESDLRLQRDFTDTILDVAGNVIVVIDLDGRFVRFNAAAEKLTGYSSEEVIGRKVWELVIPDDQQERVMSVFNNLKKGKIDISGEFENEWMTRTRQRRLLHWHNSVLRDSHGHISHIVTMGYDVTDQRQAEKEFVRMQNELQHALKMESLALLTGGIAHDFNNLLAVISGYSSLIRDKYADSNDETLIEYIQPIIDASERSAMLISQMLAFTRSNSVDRQPVQLADLLNEDMKILQATLPSSINIHCHIASDIPEVTISTGQFHQVLMNLSVNARDAMQGSGTLIIRLGLSENMDCTSTISHRPIKGDWVELSVSDTGSGLDQLVIRKIFNPFFTTKEVGKGTGMGLAMVYRIVEDHSGHILVESEPGKGSTFRILFRPISPGREKGPVAGENNFTSIPAGDGSEILIVDDELVLAKQISELLNHYGYRPCYFSNSKQALQEFTSNPDRFSLLITDQTMPEFTGIDLIEKIREIRPQLPIILCTGYSEQINKTTAEQLGISYFEKPVKSNALLTKISELLIASRTINH